MALNNRHERPGLNGVWVGDEFIVDRLDVSIADEEDATPTSSTPYFDLVCELGDVLGSTPESYARQLAAGRSMTELEADDQAAIAYHIRRQITERDLSMFTDEQWDDMVEIAIEEVWGPDAVDQASAK